MARAAHRPTSDLQVEDRVRAKSAEEAVRIQQIKGQVGQTSRSIRRPHESRATNPEATRATSHRQIIRQPHNKSSGSHTMQLPQPLKLLLIFGGALLLCIDLSAIQSPVPPWLCPSPPHHHSAPPPQCHSSFFMTHPLSSDLFLLGAA